MKRHYKIQKKKRFWLSHVLTTSVRLLEGEIVGFPVNKPSHLQTVGSSVGCVYVRELNGPVSAERSYHNRITLHRLGYT